jgi:solute carrier family 45 protein 1/2/4
MTQASLALAQASSRSQHEWVGRASVRGEGPRWLKMMYVTLSMIGLQLVWSTEMGYGQSLCSLCVYVLNPVHQRHLTCSLSASPNLPCLPSSSPVPFQVALFSFPGLSMHIFMQRFAGLIVQPLIGTYADRCRLSLGRRRPFIIGGCIVCVFALILLGFASEIASIFTRWATRAVRNLTSNLTFRCAHDSAFRSTES